MKINSLEIDTDLGRRVLQLSPPVDVDLTGEMPQAFKDLAQMFWNLSQQIATNAPAFTAPKAEA